jgi:CubicO group peptidase (beta-lactamase class C family)
LAKKKHDQWRVAPAARHFSCEVPMSLALTRRGALTALAGASLIGCTTATQSSGSANFASTQALIERYVAERKLAGVSVAVKARGADIAYLNAGALAFDTTAPASADSLYRIYSMTKPITGIAALLCVEDGTLSLDQPIADFIPEFASMRVLTGEGDATRPAQTQITARHLMTHTSGLSYHFYGTPLSQRYVAAGITPDGPTPVLGADGSPPPTNLDDFATRLATMPLDFEPGASYQYAIGLDLLGVVIQRASRMPFEQFLQARIFNPLGMDDTGFYVPANKVARLTSNYVVEEDRSLRVIDDRAASPYAAPSMPCGGAGLVSSTADYARFCAMVLGRGASGRVRIAREDTIALATSNLLPPTIDTANPALGRANFGAGMQVVTAASAVTGEEPPGSVGWSGAAGTHMWVDPSNDLYAVLMVQHFPYNAYELGSEFRRAIYADAAG